MEKRIVVAGCRDYENYTEAKAFIDLCIENIKAEHKLIFLSGGCRGADALGERYANENGYQLEIYPALWTQYGKAAGPMRNRQLAQDADYIICFWDGVSPGTKSMINYAHKLNRPLEIKIISK